MTNAERAVIDAALTYNKLRKGWGGAEAALLKLDEACSAYAQEQRVLRANPEPGRTKLTRAQREFMCDLLGAPVGTEADGFRYRNTTQLRRLLPFVRANSHLIEELPRTPRGGWGYKLKDGVDPRKVEIP